MHNQEKAEVPMPGMMMKCLDCNDDENFCGGPDRGRCGDVSKQFHPM